MISGAGVRRGGKCPRFFQGDRALRLTTHVPVSALRAFLIRPDRPTHQRQTDRLGDNVPRHFEKLALCTQKVPETQQANEGIYTPQRQVGRKTLQRHDCKCVFVIMKLSTLTLLVQNWSK